MKAERDLALVIHQHQFNGARADIDSRKMHVFMISEAY